MTMKKRLLVVWCLLLAASSLLNGQQQVVIEEMANPAGGVFNRLETSPDGRLWGVTLGGLLLGQTATSPTAPLQVVGQVGISSAVLGRAGGDQLTAQLGGFFPENGTSITLSPMSQYKFAGSYVAGYKDLDMVATLSPASIKPLCTDYVGAASMPNWPGTFPASDGSRYVVGNDNISNSAIYLRGKPDAKGVCGLTQVATLGGPVTLEAWKQADGSFLTQVILATSSFDALSSEIGIVRNGVLERRLVSTRSINSPAITASQCCDLKPDWSRGATLVTYMDGGGGHAFVYQNGVVNPIYGNEDGFFSNYIYVFGLSGQWAVLGGGSSAGFKMLLVNIQTHQRWVLTSTGDALPGGSITRAFTGSAVAITPEGVVYFTEYNNPLRTVQKLYRATIQGITGFQKPTVVFSASSTSISVGDPVTLKWNVGGAYADQSGVCIDNGVGCNLPASGSQTVYLSEATTFMMVAVGPGGKTLATVTVNVVPKVPVPAINAVTMIFGGMILPVTDKVAPGQIVTLWGNLCSDLPSNTQWFPLRTEIAGCSVKFTNPQGNIAFGNLYYVSALQLNVQAPDGIGLGPYKMTVTFNGLSSAPLALTVVGTNPNYVQEVVGSVAFLKGVHTNGSYVTATNPAVGGETILAFLTGLGSKTEITIEINGSPATVYYAGPQGQFPGLDQINVRVPDTILYASDFLITVTAVDGTQKTDRLSVEPVLSQQ